MMESLTFDRMHLSVRGLPWCMSEVSPKCSKRKRQEYVTKIELSIKKKLTTNKTFNTKQRGNRQNNQIKKLNEYRPVVGKQEQEHWDEILHTSGPDRNKYNRRGDIYKTNHKDKTPLGREGKR